MIRKVTSITMVPDRDTVEGMTVNEPTLCEVKTAINGLQNGKHPKLTPLTPLTESIRTIWQHEKDPEKLEARAHRTSKERKYQTMQ